MRARWKYKDEKWKEKDVARQTDRHADTDRQKDRIDRSVDINRYIH